MTERRRTHRSFLSYIDKSREFYAAHGYEHPYRWASNDDAPFTPLPKPLSQCRIGAVTTSYILPDDFVYRIPSDLPRLPFAAARSEVAELDNRYLSWAKDETTTDDPETFLPLGRLDEAVAAGRIGSVSDRIYGLPTHFSHRMTRERHAPQLVQWLREDEVDAVVMVPL